MLPAEDSFQLYIYTQTQSERTENKISSKQKPKGGHSYTFSTQNRLQAKKGS